MKIHFYLHIKSVVKKQYYSLKVEMESLNKGLP